MTQKIYIYIWLQVGYLESFKTLQTEGHVNAASCDYENAREFVTVGKNVQFWVYDHTDELFSITASMPPQFTRR